MHCEELEHYDYVHTVHIHINATNGEESNLTPSVHNTYIARITLHKRRVAHVTIDNAYDSHGILTW